jgi:prepilin-type N-terminal cleavage/methylation domain-containing protein
MKKGFTLVELLITIGVIALLAIVLVLIVNPIELLHQSRDASRVSDMSTLSKAVGLYYSDALSNPSTLFMGTSSVIYVSIPDPTAPAPAGNNCSGLGLPPATTGYTYHCAASSTYTNINGTGWIPINFAAYSAGSVISKLPVDPTNTTSTNLYYTYQTDGAGGFKVTSFFESQKYAPQMATDGGMDPELYEKGTNLTLVSGRGLAGYWPLDSMSGTTAIDASGNNNNGVLVGTSTWQPNGGKIGGAAQLYGQANRGAFIATSSASLQISGSMTVTGWAQATSSWQTQNDQTILIETVDYAHTDTPFNFMITDNCAGTSTMTTELQIENASATGNFGRCGATHILPGSWYFVAAVYNASSRAVDLYLNGTLDDGVIDPAATLSTPPLSILNDMSPMEIGGDNPPFGDSFTGLLDDLRIYNRALSAAEIQEMYYATK